MYHIKSYKSGRRCSSVNLIALISEAEILRNQYMTYKIYSVSPCLVLPLITTWHFYLKNCCVCFRVWFRCFVTVPVWHPRWTVLLLFGTFLSDSECLYRAPVKMAFICFLWAASSWNRGQVAVLDHKHTQTYSCCINTIHIQGVDLPLPWCWARGQLCAAPVGVSLPSLRGKHVAASQSAPAEDIH